ncbi:DNA-binding NarL/FixJ family response regulator [Oxalobacteraceae bacterium GrIS 1.11]
MNHASGTGAAALRVLLLDDDSFMLDLLGDMLAGLGDFDVVGEAHGTLALAALRQHRPHLLICDLSMPDMDGIAFLRQAAEAGFCGGVVLLSGMPPAVRQAAERLAEARGLRILGVFDKPLRRADLERVVALQQQAEALAPGAAAALDQTS